MRYLFNRDSTCLRDQEVYEEDSHELPESKEDVDAPLQRAQHVQKGCTHTHTTLVHSAQVVCAWANMQEVRPRHDHNTKLGIHPGTPTIKTGRISGHTESLRTGVRYSTCAIEMLTHDHCKQCV